MKNEKTLEEFLNEPQEPVFTEKELAAFKALGIELTDEDIEIFRQANVVCDTAEKLPENPDKLFNDIEKKIPDTEDVDAGLQEYGKLFEKMDPVITQSAALYELVNLFEEEHEEQPEVVKLDAASIQQEHDNELIAQIEKILAAI